MVTAWQQDRRRKQAQGYKATAAAGLEDLLGGISDEERRRRLAEERDVAAQKTKFDQDLRSSADERSTLREKRASDEVAARAADRAARAVALRRKEDIANQDRLKTEASSRLGVDMAGVSAADGGPDGGVSKADLDARAAALGMTGPELLAMADTDEQKRLQAEEARSSKLDLEGARTEAAERSNQPKPLRPKARGDQEVADLKKRKLKAEVEKAERDARGTGKAANKQQALPAEMANQRALKVQGLNLLDRLRTAKTKVGTGPVEGRAADLAGVVFSNPERKEFLQLNNAVQRIAGRILEGGKLAEGDARVYEKFILDPNGLDDDEYVNLLNSIQTMLEDDLSAFDQEMAASGRVVGSRKLERPVKKPADMSDDEIAARLEQLRGKK